MATNIIGRAALRKCKSLLDLTSSRQTVMPQVTKLLSTCPALSYKLAKDLPNEAQVNATSHLSYSADMLGLANQQPEPQEQDQDLIDSMMLKIRSSDEAVLESFMQFIQRAANIFELGTSGKIVLPMFADKRTLNKAAHGYRQHRYQYEQRTHGRGIKISELTRDTSDIFLEYIERMKPEGVSLTIESQELCKLPVYMRSPAAANAGDPSTNAAAATDLL